jgi:hypothetical protein
MSDHQTLPEHTGYHGKLTSWIIVVVMIGAFAVGGAALIFGSWLAFFICVGVFLLCVPVGWAIGIMDDTIAWTLPSSEARPMHDPTPPTDQFPAAPTEPAEDVERR